MKINCFIGTLAYYHIAKLGIIQNKEVQI